MPAVSKSQLRYAATVATSGKGSPKKIEWARELLQKSRGMSTAELPERKPTTKYPKFGRNG